LTPEGSLEQLLKMPPLAHGAMPWGQGEAFSRH